MPKQRFHIMLEDQQLAALRAIEARSGARIAEQIRRAIDRYLAEQKIVPQSALRKRTGK